MDYLGCAEGDWWDIRTYANPVLRGSNDYVIQPSWTGIKWTGEKGWNFTYGTGQHLFEFGYSPVQRSVNMWKTSVNGSYGSRWNIVNPVSGRFCLWETVGGTFDMVSVTGGYPISIATGDIWDSQPASSFDPSQAVVINNGILNDNEAARRMQLQIQSRLGIQNSALVRNNTHFFGVGDIIQIIGNEFLLTDITAIRTAQALREADNAGTQFIDTINHSQGTMTFKRGVGLVSPEIREKIRNQSFGGETFNYAPSLGLYSSLNTWNRRSILQKDWVPVFGMFNFFNTPTYLHSINDWSYIDRIQRKGNWHSFGIYYFDSVIDYEP